MLLIAAVVVGASAEVTLERTPNSGIQPQVGVDEKGAVHLLYYGGDPKAGDLFYTRQRDETWMKPIRVNSQEGSAIAVGTIRGGQMAVASSQSGTMVHVAWNGAKSAPDSKHEGAPMFYARLNSSGTAFEPERDLMTFTGGLDGGGSVAADNQGNVYVAWHGRAPGAKQGEIGRAVFVAKSSDGGATFAKEMQASPDGLGACGCCGMKAYVDRAGALYMLFRKAEQMVNRDEVLLVSRNQGKTFQVMNSDPWTVGTCPMSSASLSEFQTASEVARPHPDPLPQEREQRSPVKANAGTGVLAAWETAGQVRFAKIIGDKVLSTTTPQGTGKRKHPVIASKKNGETLFVWTDGTGWQKGGAVVWQIFDKDGKAIGEQRRKDGVPVWSFAGAYAKADGSFVVVY